MRKQLSKEVYIAGIRRLMGVYGHQPGFPRSPTKQGEPNADAITAWYDEFVIGKWTNDEFNYCLPLAIQQRGNFSQPIYMLAGDKECNRNSFADQRVSDLYLEGNKLKREEMDVPTAPEIQALMADAFKAMDDTPKRGLSGDALEARKKEALEKAREIEAGNAIASDMPSKTPGSASSMAGHDPGKSQRSPALANEPTA